MPPRIWWPYLSISGRGDLHRPLERRRALGDDDDRREAALLVAVHDALAHLVDVEGLLGHQRDRGAAGEAGPDRDVPDVATHHLDDEDAVVALRRGVEPVDGVGADLDRRLEAERHLGEADVVVDRLRHADDGEAVLVQAADDAHRALAADADDRVEAVPVVGLADELEAVLVGEGLVTARAEDRAAEGQDAAAAVDVEQLVVVVHDAPPGVAEADDGAVVGHFGGAGGATDDGVETGTVPAPGENADAHGVDFRLCGQEEDVDAALVRRCEPSHSRGPPSGARPWDGRRRGHPL